MRPEVFQFCQMREKHRHFTVERKDVFEFRKDRKYQWLQKACFYVLEKIGAYHNEKQSEMTRIQIDAEDFAQKLYMHRKYLYKEFNREGRVLLIGAQDFQEMMGTPDIQRLVSFPMNVREHSHGVTRIMGMQVKVVPHMRGMLVMPE